MKKTKRMMTYEDEDNDGNDDNGLLTFNQVLLAPVSSQQTAELSEKVCSTLIRGGFNKAF